MDSSAAPQDAQCSQSTVRCIFLSLLIIGIFVMFPGIALTAVGSTKPQSEYARESRKSLREIGPIFLALGLLIVCAAICFCVVQNHRQKKRFRQMAQNPQSNGPLVSGFNPVPMQPSGGGVYSPQSGTYQPAPAGTYQPAGGGGYPPYQSGTYQPAYGGSSNPVDASAPPTQQPYYQYGGATPSSTNQAYVTDSTAKEQQGFAESTAPPPSYNSVLNK